MKDDGVFCFLLFRFSSGVQGRVPFSEIVPKNRTLNTFGAQILAELYLAALNCDLMGQGGRARGVGGGVFPHIFIFFFYLCLPRIIFVINDFIVVVSARRLFFFPSNFSTRPQTHTDADADYKRGPLVVCARPFP